MGNMFASQNLGPYIGNEIPELSITIGDTKFDQFYHLPEVTDGKKSRIATNAILGRSEPILSYGGSDARSIDVTFTLHNVTKDMVEHNMKFFNYARATVYPDYSKGYAPPPIVQFQWGTLYSRGNGKFPIDCVVTDVNITVSPDTPYFFSVVTGSLCPLWFTIKLSMLTIEMQELLPGFNEVCNNEF